MKRNANYRTEERRHFDKLAQTAGEVWWGSSTEAGIERQRRRVKLISQALSTFHDPAVLEIGCGTGAFSRFLLEEIPLLRLVGCDISPECIRVAKDKYGGYKKVTFEVADVSELPYDKCSFEAVIGNAILHHLPLVSSLQECLRVLKPGGIVYFFEPNMMNPQIAIEKNIHFIGKMLQNTRNETAFFRWKLKKVLYEIGFAHVSVQPFDFLHPLVPQPMIGIVDAVGRIMEGLPLLKEIAGSLLISASRPE